jgi:hypothetical protein
MLKVMVSAICVLGAAMPLASHASAAQLKASDIAGRWQGETYAQEKGGNLTLDIVACGAGWCGIRVAENDTCAGTALKVDGGTLEGENVTFKGTLEMAPGTEPYTVQANIFTPEEGKQPTLQIIGDTGGQFRAFRRSFPFEARMARTHDALCKPPQTVSSLAR